MPIQEIFPDVPPPPPCAILLSRMSFKIHARTFKYRPNFKMSPLCTRVFQYLFYFSDPTVFAHTGVLSFCGYGDCDWIWFLWLQHLGLLSF